LSYPCKFKSIETASTCFMSNPGSRVSVWPRENQVDLTRAKRWLDAPLDWLADASVRTLPCHRFPETESFRLRCFRTEHLFTTGNSLLRSSPNWCTHAIRRARRVARFSISEIDQEASSRDVGSPLRAWLRQDPVCCSAQALRRSRRSFIGGPSTSHGPAI
jgi:hypothetical protein